MPLNLAFEAIELIVELFRISLTTAIPAFVLTLAGSYIHKRVSKRFSLSWAQSAILSTYLVVTSLIIVLYLVPLYIGFSSSTIGPAPPEMQLILIDWILIILYAVVKIALTGLVYTILLLPLIFVGTFVLEKLRSFKKVPELANKFIAVLACSALAWIIVFFIFPWIFGGLIYLLYWG